MKPATTKDFQAKQFRRISKMRSLLMVYYRFYGTLLTALPDAERADIETAATDGRNIYWNLQFVATLTDAELVFVLAHEVLHCSLMHHLRRMGRDSLLWNVAGDYVINAMLIAEGVGEMPDGCLHDPRFAGMSVEAIYEVLRQEQQEQQQADQDQPQGEQADDGDSRDNQGNDRDNQGNDPTDGTQDSEQQGDGEGDAEGSESAQDGQGGAAEGGEAQDGEGGSAGVSEAQGDKPAETNGSGGSESAKGSPARQGGEIDPGRCGGVIDAPGDVIEQAEQAADWERHVREAVAQQMRSEGAGNCNPTSKAILEAVDDRQVNWEQELAEFVNESASKDYSWAKRDIRFSATPFIVPGEISDGVPHLLWVHDASGSMSDELCTKMAAVAQSMLDSGLVDRVTVIKVDTAVRSVEEYVAGDSIDLSVPRCGGTDFQPAWDFLAEMDEQPIAVIYATDLDVGGDFGEEPPVPVLWLAGTSSEWDREALRKRMATVPFGRCVEVR